MERSLSLAKGFFAQWKQRLLLLDRFIVLFMCFRLISGIDQKSLCNYPGPSPLFLFVFVGQASEVPKVANPDDSKSPDKVDAKLTNTSPKRSLLQQKRDKDEGSSNRKRKAPDSAGEPSQSITPEKASHSTSEGLSDSTPEKVPDNKRRAHCEICEKPRSSLQRGAACPSCLLTLKRTEGHQSLSKLREDPNKLQQIREESLVAQESASKEKTEADPVAKRLARVEVMLQKLMNHFNIA